MSATITGGQICHVSITRRIAGVLREWRGTSRGSMKAGAREVGVPVETFRNWWDATSTPRAPELIRLMAACEELEQEVQAMVHEIRRGRP